MRAALAAALCGAVATAGVVVVVESGCEVSQPLSAVVLPTRAEAPLATTPGAVSLGMSAREPHSAGAREGVIEADVSPAVEPAGASARLQVQVFDGDTRDRIWVEVSVGSQRQVQEWSNSPFFEPLVFELTPGDHRVTLSRDEGRSVRTVDVRGVLAGQRRVLDHFWEWPEQTYRGRVVDRDGIGLGGAEVELSRFSYTFGNTVPVARARTDALGAFELVGSIEGRSIAVSARGHPRHEVSLGAPPHAARLADGRDVVIELADGVDLRARVIDEIGRPRAGVTVQLLALEGGLGVCKGVSWRGETDEHGGLSMEDLPTGIPLRVFLRYWTLPDEGGTPTTRCAGVSELLEQHSYFLSPVTLRADEERLFEWTLGSARLDVTLRPNAGKLPSNAYLQLRALTGEDPLASSARCVDGRVSFAGLVPGTYELRSSGTVSGVTEFELPPGILRLEVELLVD